MKSTTFGLDIAKRIFQLHWVDMSTGQIHRRQLKRDDVAEFFAQRERCVIAMEACGSAHYWARKLTGLGHEVRLIAAQFVRPFVKTNKTDAADAQGIWEAIQRPDMKFVAIKSEAQQSILTLHRLREQLVKVRTMQTNQLRGLLYEFGACLPVGRIQGLAQVGQALAQLEQSLPAMVIEALRQQLRRLHGLDADIKDIEDKLVAWKKEERAVGQLMSIPGVGILTASAAVATIGQAGAFKNGRQLAAYLGLVPRQSGTGGRVRLLGISKRGNVYLRTLLIHGARTVVTRQKQRDPWIDRLLARRPFNAVVVALANKMARTIWALLAHDRTYQKDYAASTA
jgi:transposase